MSGLAGPVQGPPRRWWSVVEADAYLPALDRLFETVEAAVDRARSRPAVGADPRLLLHGLVATLSEDGVLVRDLSRRLIDFPGRGPDGREVVWCRIGTEPTITWWHDPDAGFAGRRNLVDDPPW